MLAIIDHVKRGFFTSPARQLHGFPRSGSGFDVKLYDATVVAVSPQSGRVASVACLLISTAGAIVKHGLELPAAGVVAVVGPMVNPHVLEILCRLHIDTDGDPV